MKSLLLAMTVLIPALAQAGGTIVAGGLNDRAIEVSFLSPGYGIDEAAKAEILTLVREGLSNETIAVVTAEKQSFEGDITYCIEYVNADVMSQNFHSVDHIVTSGKNVSGLTVPNCLHKN